MIFGTTAFWRDLAVRAIKTFAQSAVALLAAGATGLFTVDWMNLLSVAGLAAVASVFTSIASADTVGGDLAVKQAAAKTDTAVVVAPAPLAAPQVEHALTQAAPVPTRTRITKGD